MSHKMSGSAASFRGFNTSRHSNTTQRIVQNRGGATGRHNFDNRDDFGNLHQSANGKNQNEAIVGSGFVSPQRMRNGMSPQLMRSDNGNPRHIDFSPDDFVATGQHIGFHNVREIMANERSYSPLSTVSRNSSILSPGSVNPNGYNPQGDFAAFAMMPSRVDQIPYDNRNKAYDGDLSVEVIEDESSFSSSNDCRNHFLKPNDRNKYATRRNMRGSDMNGFGKGLEKANVQRERDILQPISKLRHRTIESVNSGQVNLSYATSSTAYHPEVPRYRAKSPDFNVEAPRHHSNLKRTASMADLIMEVTELKKLRIEHEAIIAKLREFIRTIVDGAADLTDFMAKHRAHTTGNFEQRLRSFLKPAIHNDPTSKNPGNGNTRS